MSGPTVVAVIQARMGSTRLPGKVLLQAGGASVLEHVVRRVRAVPRVDRVVVATSDLPQDDPIAAAAVRYGALVTRGSQDDVLARFARAFREHGGDVGIRVTSDCPLLDPRLIGDAVARFVAAAPPLDYLSNTVVRSYPRGYDFEIFGVPSLLAADSEATDASSREHVTPFLYRNPDRFRCGAVERVDAVGSADWRLTLDTEDDWRVLRHILEALAPADPLFGLDVVERFVGAHPDIVAWNRHIEQKAH